MIVVIVFSGFSYSLFLLSTLCTVQRFLLVLAQETWVYLKQFCIATTSCDVTLYRTIFPAYGETHQGLLMVTRLRVEFLRGDIYCALLGSRVFGFRLSVRQLDFTLWPHPWSQWKNFDQENLLLFVICCCPTAFHIGWCELTNLLFMDFY